MCPRNPPQSCLRNPRGSVFLHLKAEVNRYRLFHDLIADFDVAKLEARQTKALEEARVPEAA